MAGLAESVNHRLVVKMYASGDIDATTEPVAAVDPGADGGQVLRHTTHTLGLSKDSFRPNEKNQDAQQAMGKQGSRTVTGAINGYLSAGTQKALFAAVMRAQWSAPVALDETDLTSATFDADAKTVSFGSGDPVALGMTVGRSISFGSLATAANNRSFLILGFSGPNNRTVTLFPAPTTETADNAFTVTVRGGALINPPTRTQRTNYKAAIEAHDPAPANISRLYKEVRFTGFDLSAGVNDNVTLNFNVLGRNREILTSGAAPFFTSPAAETTTDVPTAMHGLIIRDGAAFAVVTAVNLKVDLGAEAAKPQHPEGLIAGINLGDFVATGDFTMFLITADQLLAYDNETEFSLLLFFPESKAPTAPANSFLLPRVKITSNSESEVNKARAIQCQFEAARYFGSTPGLPSTTLQISDTTIT